MKTSFGAVIGIIVVSVIILLIFLAIIGRPIDQPEKTVGDSVLPDVMASIRTDGGAERRLNTRDEYAPLVRRYGQPSSILSSESDPDKPPVPSMVVRYDAAHVKIGLVPIGCVEPYIRSAEVIGDTSSYPRLAQDFVDKMRAHPCVGTAPGWTIMGYIDSSDNTAASAEFARFRLDRMKN